MSGLARTTGKNGEDFALTREEILKARESDEKEIRQLRQTQFRGTRE